jgi:hypothetical protein
MRANLEKQQWFLEQLEINRIAFDGEWFYPVCEAKAPAFMPGMKRA